LLTNMFTVVSVEKLSKSLRLLKDGY
jgi:hypothetical protein